MISKNYILVILDVKSKILRIIFNIGFQQTSTATEPAGESASRGRQGVIDSLVPGGTDILALHRVSNDTVGAALLRRSQCS